MPAQKRSSPEDLTGDDEDPPRHHQQQRPKQSRPQDEARVAEASEDEHDPDEAYDSEGGSSYASQEKPEFIFVQLSEIGKDVHCPICLGIIKKTRTVMECLHRFCRACIDKSMRMGNNECPACRTHCASRRPLRDDPNYDALIAALYPDIEKYEEEELAFHDEERTRNELIQASIAQIFQRQSEALMKRRAFGKDTENAFIMRSQRSSRSSFSKRQNSQTTEILGSEDNEDENLNINGRKNSSYDDRRSEIRPRGLIRQPGFGSSQHSSSRANSSGGCTEYDLEVNRENLGISPGLAGSSEMLAWGRGGARSNTRYGTASGCNNKNSRSSRISKLVDYLQSLEKKNDELDAHLWLISLDKRCTPSLQQPHLFCQSSLPVKHLCEYVSRLTSLQADEVELFAVKGYPSSNDEDVTPNSSALMNEDCVPLPIDPRRYGLQVLETEETLAGVQANCTSSRDHLVLAYRRKEIENVELAM